jgi:hypothetical protein
MGAKMVTGLVLVVTAALLAGCGGGTSARTGSDFMSVIDPDCQASVSLVLMRMTGVREGDVHTRLVYSSGRGESSKCAYRAGGERLTIQVDSTPQAYMAFETVNDHQVQANVGRSDSPPAGSYPKQVNGVGTLASWIPSERQLIATNATRTGGGAFVRVTMLHRDKSAPPDRKAAKIIARASLRTAPRGPGSAR